MGYSRVVRTGRHVAVTGTTSFVAGREPVTGDAYAQTIQILRNVDDALARVGSSVHDVVRTRMFVTDIQSDWEAIGRAHAEVFGEIRPATTMVEVAALIEPWMRVEIEVDAILGAPPPEDVPDVRIGSAKPDEVRSLLTASELGPAALTATILAARDGDQVVGSVAWRTVDGETLVHSLAVDPAWRDQGVASLLLETALLRTPGPYWVFTEGAAPYFARFGFAVETNVPDALREAAGQRCKTATVMRRSSLDF